MVAGRSEGRLLAIAAAGKCGGGERVYNTAARLPSTCGYMMHGPRQRHAQARRCDESIWVWGGVKTRGCCP